MCLPAEPKRETIGVVEKNTETPSIPKNPNIQKSSFRERERVEENAKSREKIPAKNKRTVNLLTSKT